MHDRIRTGTLQKIAEQCGADDFHAWCQWINEHRCGAATNADFRSPDIDVPRR